MSVRINEVLVYYDYSVSCKMCQNGTFVCKLITDIKHLYSTFEE